LGSASPLSAANFRPTAMDGGSAGNAGCNFRPSAQLRADLDELGEEDRVERALQELDARCAARAGLTADDALDRLHVMEAPRLEVDLDVHEPFRDLVRGPVLIGMLVDRLQHLDDAGMML